MKDNTCICCGQIVPEGRTVCPECEAMWTEEKHDK